MAAFYTYVGAVFQSWFFYMTAGPFLLDEVFKRACPKTRERFGKLFPAKGRRKIEVVLIILGVFYAGFAAFKEERTARETAENSLRNATPPPYQLLETDPQARKQIDELKRELAAQKEAMQNTIQTEQSQSDPLARSLVSAEFSVVINFKSKKESSARYMSSGALVTLGKQQNGQTDEILLQAGCSEHYSDGGGHSRFVADSSFDGPSMGKAIRSLSEATMMQLEFVDDFAPMETEIEGGHVALMLNNQISLHFEIPAQVLKQKTNDHPVIVVGDIKKGLEPLLKQSPESAATPKPSPTL